MKAIIKGLGMSGEINIQSITPTIEMPIYKVDRLGDWLQEPMTPNTESAMKRICFKFMRQLNEDTALYELEGWI